MASSSVLQSLALEAIVGPIAGTCGIVMITQGRTKDYLRLGVAQAVCVSIAVCIGINWGLIGMAMASAAHTLLSLPLLVWFSFKDTPISPGLFYEVLRFPALASGTMSVLPIAFRHLLEIPSGLVEIGYSGSLAPLLYCGVWMLLP